MNAKKINRIYNIVAIILATALGSLLAHPQNSAYTFWSFVKSVGLIVLFRFAFDLLKPILLRPVLRKAQR